MSYAGISVDAWFEVFTYLQIKGFNQQFILRGLRWIAHWYLGMVQTY